MKRILALFIICIAIYSSICMAQAADQNKTVDNEDNIVTEYLSGQFAAKNGDFATAALRFEEALVKNPQDASLLRNTYQFMLLSGKYDKASLYASRYLEHDKHDINALILQAIKAVSEGKYSKASVILENFPQISKEKSITSIDQLIVPFVRMWIIAGERNYDVALNLLDPRDSASVVSGTFLALQKALLFSTSGDIENASKTFAMLTAENVVMPYNLAKSAATFYESIGKWDEAKNIYSRYKIQHPALPHFEDSDTKIANKITSGIYIQNPKEGLAEVMKETARLLFSNQLYGEGLVYLRLALMLRPLDHETIVLVASYNEQNGNLAKAIDLYDIIGSDSDFYIIAQVNKAEALYKLNKKSQAKKILINISEKITAKYIPLVTLADLLRRDNQFKDAIKIYTKLLETIDQKSRSSWTIFFARGMCYERLKDWEKAEADMLKALELNPDQPEVLNYLAYSWIDQNKNLEKARDMLLKAVAKKPKDPQILDSAGWALYKLKDYKNAIIFLEKATEYLPQDAVINDHLGDSYWMDGRRYEARYQWQRAIKYGPAESSSLKVLNRKIEKGLE